MQLLGLRAARHELGLAHVAGGAQVDARGDGRLRGRRQHVQLGDARQRAAAARVAASRRHIGVPRLAPCSPAPAHPPHLTASPQAFLQPAGRRQCILAPQTVQPCALLTSTRTSSYLTASHVLHSQLATDSTRPCGWAAPMHRPSRGTLCNPKPSKWRGACAPSSEAGTVGNLWRTSATWRWRAAPVARSSVTSVSAAYARVSASSPPYSVNCTRAPAALRQPSAAAAPLLASYGFTACSSDRLSTLSDCDTTVVQNWNTVVVVG